MDFGLYIFFALASCFVGSIVLALAGHRWINFLYDRNEKILSFPDTRKERGRFRPFLLATAFCFAGLRCLFIASSGSELFFLLFASVLLLLMTATDFEQYCLFDAMMLPFALGGAAMTLLAYGGWDHWIAAAVGGAVFLLLAILSRGALGGGDVKLIAALGLWFGSDGLFFISMVGIIFGGLAAFLLLLLGLKKRKSAFAYGPYFALTALALLLLKSM